MSFNFILCNVKQNILLIKARCAWKGRSTGCYYERQGREYGGTMSANAATMSAKHATMAGP